MFSKERFTYTYPSGLLRGGTVGTMYPALRTPGNR